MSVFSIWIVQSKSHISATNLGLLASNNSSTLERPWAISQPSFTTQPEWKVLIVNWVPGSQIDCAAITQTGVQISTSLFDPKSSQ